MSTKKTAALRALGTRAMAPTLDDAKAVAKATIDDAAEAARRRWITPGSGQALEYEQTRSEAEAAQSAADPLDAADYPHLEAERLALESVGTALTLREVAQSVIDTEAAWTTASAEIKRLRRTAKLQVDAAASEAEINGLVGISWP